MAEVVKRAAIAGGAELNTGMLLASASPNHRDAGEPSPAGGEAVEFFLS